MLDAGPPAGYTPGAAPANRRLPRSAGVAAIGVAVLSLIAGGAFWLVAGGGPGTTAAHAAALPRAGVLVRGQSLAGVQLGDTEADVRALWGRHFTVCSGCDGTTWFYMYPTGDPFGAGDRFRNGHVTAVFTLGAPSGWHDDAGLQVGEVLDPQEATSGEAIFRGCMGYGAKSTREGEAVSSVLMQGLGVYGFALTSAVGTGLPIALAADSVRVPSITLSLLCTHFDETISDPGVC